jgi:hypothetical protein
MFLAQDSDRSSSHLPFLLQHKALHLGCATCQPPLQESAPRTLSTRNIHNLTVTLLALHPISDLYNQCPLLRNFGAVLSGIHLRAWDVSNSNRTLCPWIEWLPDEAVVLNFIWISWFWVTEFWRKLLPCGRQTKHDEQEQRRSGCVPSAGDPGDVIGDVSSHPSRLMIAAACEDQRGLP